MNSSLTGFAFCHRLKCSALEATFNFAVRILVVSLVFLLPGVLIAGPPLVTDDPGILEPGSWETILAIAGHDHDFGKALQAPVLDVSLGVSGNTQLSMVLPHFVIRSDDLTNNMGLTTASIGYKWQFHSSESTEWAIAASYSLPISHDIISEGGSDDVRVISIPLLASFQQAQWTWLGQAGLNVSNDGTRFWDYGLAVGRPVGKSLQLMIEVYGTVNSAFEENTLNYQLGLDFELNPAWHVLASAGSRIRSVDPVNQRLNYSFYLGLQWFK